MLDGYVQLLTGTSLSGNIATGERLTGPLDRPNIGMFTARMGFPLLAAALTLAASKRISASRLVLLAGFALVAFAFIILSGERTAAILTMMAVLFGAGIEIGRASCRERVCQYGLNSGGAVA